MSRKIIQLGYLVPNTERHITAFEEVLKYFVDKRCLAKEELLYRSVKKMGRYATAARKMNLYHIRTPFYCYF